MYPDRLSKIQLIRSVPQGNMVMGCITRLLGAATNIFLQVTYRIALPLHLIKFLLIILRIHLHALRLVDPQISDPSKIALDLLLARKTCRKIIKRRLLGGLIVA